MRVPGVVAADLVLVEANLVLRGLERFLDRPPGAGHTDQFPQPGASGTETQVVGDLGRVADAAAGQHPAPPALRGRTGPRQPRPLASAGGPLPAPPAHPRAPHT